MYISWAVQHRQPVHIAMNCLLQWMMWIDCQCTQDPGQAGKGACWPRSMAQNNWIIRFPKQKNYFIRFYLILLDFPKNKWFYGMFLEFYWIFKARHILLVEYFIFRKEANRSNENLSHGRPGLDPGQQITVSSDPDTYNRKTQNSLGSPITEWPSSSNRIL